VPALGAAVALAVAVWRWGPRRRRPVYLLDFDCWKCDPKLKVSLQRFMQGSSACEVSDLRTPNSVRFDVFAPCYPGRRCHEVLQARRLRMHIQHPAVSPWCAKPSKQR